jgi:hypothetical protein
MVAASLLNTVATFGARLRSVEQLNEASVGKTYAVRDDYYGMLERYYASEVYQRTDAKQSEIAAWKGLPKTIRPIALVAKRAADWWAGSVYPGTWTDDGAPAANGRPNRIPYDPRTPDELRICVQQAFTWGNGNGLLGTMVLQGAKLGNIFAEVEVHWNADGNPQSHKVYPVLIHPRHVVDLELNSRGDVKRYRLAIPRPPDEHSRSPYLWGKEVTKDSITFYLDDDPYSYEEGQPATVPNQYGFVAASWIPHQTTSGIHGAPAIDGIIPTIDEIQGLLAANSDYAHKFANQGAVIETGDPKGLRDFLMTGRSGTVGDEYAPPALANQNGNVTERNRLNAWPAPEGTNVHHLIQSGGIGGIDEHIRWVMHEIEKALPEIVLAEKLLDMSQITGPVAHALAKRVEQKLDDVSANYDSLGPIKLGQMCAAIGGYLANTGQWGLRSRLTPNQQKFLPFTLDSFQRDELNFGLQPRELIPVTMAVKLQEAAAIEALTTAAGLRHAGFSDEQIYGTDEQGNSLAPEPRPGILEGQQVIQRKQADIAALLAAEFNAGIGGV